MAQLITLRIRARNFLCIKNVPKPLFYSVFDKQCQTKANLAQLITLKMARLGPVNISTAYTPSTISDDIIDNSSPALSPVLHCLLGQSAKRDILVLELFP